MRKSIQPKNLVKPKPPYSPVVRSGDLVFVAGQTAHDSEGNLVGEGDAEAQALKVLQNLEHALDAAGATLSDVVRTTVYLTDMSNYATVNDVYREFFPEEQPARATLQVQLVQPQWLVEIDAIAVLDNNKDGVT